MGLDLRVLPVLRAAAAGRPLVDLLSLLEGGGRGGEAASRARPGHGHRPRWRLRQCRDHPCEPGGVRAADAQIRITLNPAPLTLRAGPARPSPRPLHRTSVVVGTGVTVLVDL